MQGEKRGEVDSYLPGRRIVGAPRCPWAGAVRPREALHRVDAAVRGRWRALCPRSLVLNGSTSSSPSPSCQHASQTSRKLSSA
jgi:hypothetical protein